MGGSFLPVLILDEKSPVKKNISWYWAEWVFISQHLQFGQYPGTALCNPDSIPPHGIWHILRHVRHYLSFSLEAQKI